MIGLVVVLHVDDPVVKLLTDSISIKSRKLRVINERIICATSIPVQTRRSSVVVVKYVRENLNTLTQMIIEGPPDKLHLLVLESLLFVLVIKSREEPGVYSHVSEQSRIGVRVTKGINVPTNSRSHSELFLKELVTVHHVKNDVFVVRTGFIIHAPSTVDELKTTISD